MRSGWSWRSHSRVKSAEYRLPCCHPAIKESVGGCEVFMDRRALLWAVAAGGVATTAAVSTTMASPASATIRPAAVPRTIYAQRAGLTLPDAPVPGIVYSCRLALFSDEALKTAIGNGSASATVVGIEVTDPVAALTTPLVQSTIVLTATGTPPAAVTLSALFRRSATYPRSYDAIATGGYGAWAPATDTSAPSARITAHGPGNGDYLTIVLATPAP